MGVLGSVITPSTVLMTIRNSQILGCGPIGPQVIRYELIWHKSGLLQKLAHEFQRRPLVPPTLNQRSLASSKPVSATELSGQSPKVMSTRDASQQSIVWL